MSFIKIYDNVLTVQQCASLIRLYEDSDQKEYHDNLQCPQFHQIKIDDQHYQRALSQLVMMILAEYAKDCACEHVFPETKHLEQFRVKKYEPNSGDQFATHVDAVSTESAVRYAALLFYLNDDFEGGETEFELGGSKVKVTPKTGSVVVFPPMWMYPHAGLPVTGGSPKYILSTYARFS